jgi:predicted Fe-S protein YdhL (DUF1289 family)
MLTLSQLPPVRVERVKSISKVVSPCIKICTLQNDFCIGCGRTTQEIAEWSKASDKKKRDILERLPDRLRRML